MRRAIRAGDLDIAGRIGRSPRLTSDAVHGWLAQSSKQHRPSDAWTSPALTGRWEGFRFILGPWRWMIIVYVYLEEEDRVVVTIQDGRS